MCTGNSQSASAACNKAAAVGALGTGLTAVSSSNQLHQSSCISTAMAETPLQQCVSASQPQVRSSSPSRTRCRLLARGASCPQPRNQQQLSMESLEILRPLACSHSCFVSIVRISDVSSSDGQPAGTLAVPAEAATGCSLNSSVASAASCKQGVAKSYRKSKLDEDEARQVELEIKLHHQLSACCQHVVPFWAALDSLDSTTILTAHCEGDLRSTLQQAGGALSEAAVQEQVAAPLLDVLVHMHRLGFVHRDIKPENVFVSGKRAMLGDFGLAIAMPSDAAASSNGSSSRNSPCSSSSSSSSRHTAVNRSGRCSAGGCLFASSYGTSTTASRQAALLRSCSSTSSLSNLPGASSGAAAGASSSRVQQGGSGVAVLRRSSSCGAVGFDCGVIPQLKQLQAGGTPAYTAPEVVQATFNSTPLEAAVGPQVSWGST
ncbi:kinase-like domain-containing protein [Scenedesmus sp. NREL 46B-D3]|nr:kinase-like domain-containing protein [Scenedesmus sp. NREL 46B-D3]